MDLGTVSQIVTLIVGAVGLLGSGGLFGYIVRARKAKAQGEIAMTNAVKELQHIAEDNKQVMADNSKKLDFAVSGLVAEIRESLVDYYETVVVDGVPITVERTNQLDVMYRVLEALDDENGTGEDMYREIKKRAIHIEPTKHRKLEDS